MDNWKKRLKKDVEANGFEMGDMISIHTDVLESFIEKAIIEEKKETIKECGGQWLSPIKTEREYQERRLKKIWAGYPNCSFRWQYLNGLIHMTLEQLKTKQ